MPQRPQLKAQNIVIIWGSGFWGAESVKKYQDRQRAREGDINKMIESLPVSRHPLDSEGINKVEERSEIERRDNTRDAPLSNSRERDLKWV